MLLQDTDKKELETCTVMYLRQDPEKDEGRQMEEEVHNSHPQ